MRKHEAWKTIPAALALIAVACSPSSDAPPTGVTPRVSPALIVGPNPTAPNPQGEQIVVCKVGGEGTYDFTVTGGVNTSFSLLPGECWDLGFFGGAGVSVDITETPKAGSEVVSITVDQLSSADQNIAGPTNTVTGVLGSGTPSNSALVTFTNQLVTTGTEGCTPGYWKQDQHLDSWEGYDPDDLFSSVFTVQADDGLPADLTLLQALELNGGGANALARHAVAALLNSASSGVNYPYTTAEVIADVNAAYLSNDYESTKDDLAAANELGCPIS